jgi:hypothetical protein
MPTLVWASVVVVCLLGMVVLDVRRIKRGAADFQAVEAERIARENSAPLGNVDRLG